MIRERTFLWAWVILLTVCVGVMWQDRQEPSKDTRWLKPDVKVENVTVEPLGVGCISDNSRYPVEWSDDNLRFEGTTSFSNSVMFQDSAMPVPPIRGVKVYSDMNDGTLKAIFPNGSTCQIATGY